MKNLIVVCLLPVTLLACGGTPAPEGSPDGSTEPQACVGDQDCPHMNKCIQNECIENPECEVETDCLPQSTTPGNPGGPNICFHGKCVPYAATDPCVNQPCKLIGSVDCTTCGIVTTCQADTCVDTCPAFNEMQSQIKDEVCKGLPCLECKCWNDNRKIKDGGIGCKEGTSYGLCRVSIAKMYKATMENESDYAEAIAAIYKNFEPFKHSCIENPAP